MGVNLPWSTFIDAGVPFMYLSRKSLFKNNLYEHFKHLVHMYSYLKIVIKMNHITINKLQYNCNYFGDNNFRKLKK